MLTVAPLPLVDNIPSRIPLKTFIRYPFHTYTTLMTVLSISTDLNSQIHKKAHHISAFVQSEADKFVAQDEHFSLIHNAVHKILEINHFVKIKNIGFLRNKVVFESFIKLFGYFYGVVEYTGIKLDCPYTGCNYSSLLLHTDDAIDLNNPKYTFIQVLAEDPNGDAFGWNGVVKIDEVFEHLAVHDHVLLDKLFNHKFPLLSYGISAYSDDRDELIIREPIFSYHKEILKVRFDLSRIKYFYFKKNLQMPKEEKMIIEKFLSACHQFRKRYYLSKGDILIVDNHRTLHDREETTIELNQDGSLTSREIFVSFAYEKD
jgi:hypothetical protein